MTEFVKLPVSFVPKGMSEEEVNSKVQEGSDYDSVSTRGMLYTNKTHIAAFNETTDGCVTMRLSSGEAWRVELTLKEFIRKIS